jgi:heme/copper-type cytochrome/quinol oxidase subunit 4
MNALKNFSLSGIQLTRIKLALLLSFSSLLLLQLLVGFESFDDYLIVFVYVLFLNDLYIKIKKPDMTFYHDERFKRSIMSIVFLVLFTLPFVLDAFNVADSSRMLIYRLGYMLWAQIFLLDAFVHYRQTQSRKWLIIANMAALFIVVGAFV